jgi:CRP/FNR family cyclic AMP-dependent transcriptional regulator
MQGSRKTTRHRSVKVDLSLESLLENIVGGKELLQLRKGATLFSQGEEADALYFMQTGKVQLTVVSTQGKKAVLATMWPRDFFGEECLVAHSRRMSTSTSLRLSTVFRIEKRAMLQALHSQPRLSEQFIASLLVRNVNLEGDLCDQLFNHSERRLASLLLNLSRFGPHGKLPDAKVSNFTHKMLAEIVGTTRPRISFFMTKFRKLGLIQYHKGNTDIIVMADALTDSILSDEFKAAEAACLPSN